VCTRPTRGCGRAARRGSRGAGRRSSGRSDESRGAGRGGSVRLAGAEREATGEKAVAAEGVLWKMIIRYRGVSVNIRIAINNCDPI
jgi:hypothetical protein